ncbi:MAG: NAD-dependent epimerase/dehydratase family protein [Calditrichaeota bacterium]|nr:NAD-dependent epimerase/dehydratase family protein [Calditrichota bacterium]
MKTFVTGASGFVGRAIVAELLRRHHEPFLLVRPGSEAKLREIGAPPAQTIHLISGDILKPESYAGVLKSVDAVIHLVGIIREFGRARFDLMHRVATENIVRESELAGIKRYMHMSACGVGRLSKSVYMRTKLAGERIVRASRLNWTIFRPSILYGRQDGFVTPFIKRFRRLPIAPLIDGGRTLFQFIAMEDVARLFVDAAERSDLAGRTFEIGGRGIYSFKQTIDEIAGAMGKRIMKIPIPNIALFLPAIFLDRFRFFPISRDQLRMLAADNICDSLEYIEVFGLEPRDFLEGLRTLAKRTYED